MRPCAHLLNTCPAPRVRPSRTPALAGTRHSAASWKPGPEPRAPSPGPLAHFSFSSENCFSRSIISLTHSLRRRS